MPLTSKGSKILGNMQKEYGGEKGKSVFYASINKGTIKGVHGKGKHHKAAAVVQAIQMVKQARGPFEAGFISQCESRGIDPAVLLKAGQIAPERFKPPSWMTGAPSPLGTSLLSDTKLVDKLRQMMATKTTKAAFTEQPVPGVRNPAKPMTKKHFKHPGAGEQPYLTGATQGQAT
jgi:hypothetical protein